MHKKHVITISISILVIVVGLLVGHQFGPFYGTNRLDPAYAYLFNGLGLLQGLTPGHTDHPGTTVQEIAAITILLNWSMTALVGVKQSVADSVLSHSENYLTAINFVLFSLVAAAAGLAVRCLIERTGRLWLSLLAPALMLSSPSVLTSLAGVEPEPLLIALAIPAVLLALPSTQLGRRARTGRAAMLGLVLGAGIVTKVTFAPLALFALALPEITSIAVAGFFAALACALLACPIWPVLHHVFGWLKRLATHQGTYGEGEPGLPSASSLLDGAWQLLESEPLFALGIVVLGMAVVSGFTTRDPERQSWRRLFGIGLVVVLLQLAITTPRPTPHYLVPSLTAIAILTPLAWHFGIWDVAHARAAKVVAAAAFGLVVWSGIDEFGRQIDMARQQAIALRHVGETLERANCRLLPYYSFGSLEYAMEFGNSYMRYYYASELTRLYQNYITFNLWAENIETFSGIQNETISSDIYRYCLVGSTELSTLRRVTVSKIAEDGGLFYYTVDSVH
jgi:hypothetical protein